MKKPIKGAKKINCIHCGHKVAGGGNKHKNRNCPPRRGAASARKNRKKAATRVAESE